MIALLLAFTGVYQYDPLQANKYKFVALISHIALILVFPLLILCLEGINSLRKNEAMNLLFVDSDNTC